MPLRYKLYYMSTGFHIMGAILASMAHAMYLLSWCVFMTYISWRLAESLIAIRERENNE